MKKTLTRLLSLVLTVALSISAVPMEAFAAGETEVYLPEIEIGNDILDHDVFYLATASAALQEEGHNVYRLRVGRGGNAESEATALIKIADMTAKYGEDYVVRVWDGGAKVENPEDNFSLMEMMEGSDFEQRAVSDDADTADALENDPEAQAAYQEGVESALEFLEDASGLSEKYGDEDPYAEALEEQQEEDTGDDYAADADARVIPANGDGEVLSIGGDGQKQPGMSLQDAANLFTGQNATPQRLTSDGDMLQDLQAVANVMTNVVVGASVELNFALGETEKYLEIVPKDNKTGDGDRMFYIILGAPSGSTTNSSASSCAFTIVDDEEQEPSAVSFSDAEYYYDGVSESVTVTVNREGAMNTVVSAKVKTTGEGTAQAGRDYSEVDTTLVFPFGVDHLSVTIPVRTEYLTGEGSFGLALVPDTGCELGETPAATVCIGGTYTGKASLLEAVTSKLQAEGSATLLGASSTVDKNNLSSYKTLDAVNVSKPLFTDTYGNGFSGHNYYNSAGFYHTMWKGTSTGSVQTVYQLSDYWTSYYLAGAEVNWWRSYGCSDRAYMKIAIGGCIDPYDRRCDFGWPFHFSGDVSNKNGYRDANGNYVYWYPYDSNRDFGNETRYVYPHKNAVIYEKQGVKSQPVFGGDHPGGIELLNIGFCDDCSQLWIWGIKPILRPFQVNIIKADGLTYLKSDGTRSTVESAVTADAEIRDAGSQAVFFMDDTFTVKTVSGSDAAQCGYLSALKLLDGNGTGKAIATLAKNKNPSETSISYTLDEDNMADLILQLGGSSYRRGSLKAWCDLLKENPYAKKSDGYATYAQYNIKPEFSYVDSSVTLRNPYDFPVTMTISGTNYALAAKETRKIEAGDGQGFHKGDDLAVSKITLGQAGSDTYTALGVKYWAKYQSTAAKWDKEGTWNFIDSATIHVSGTQDNRLNYSEIVIEPNLQISSNTIQVRVKTSDLPYFLTEDVKDESGNVTQGAGLLGTAGTVEGEYTYFTCADRTRTVNGKLYAITATPKDSGMVCVWYDANTLRYYEGNTLYFTAGAEPARNVITLSAEKAGQTVTLQGTLKYNSYNLRTGAEGIESNVPASGAVLAAGSAGGVANGSGYVSAGPISVTGGQNRYLRYIVSVNGNDMVKELLLPVAKNAPVLLWDFNQDNNMNSVLGKSWNNQISEYGGASDGQNSYYSFRISGKDPYISVDTPLSDAGQIRYGKIRYKNMTNGGGFELFAGMNGGLSGAENVRIPLKSKMAESDAFQEAIFEIPAGKWSGDAQYFRLDPAYFDSAVSGNLIYIDYIAFFKDRDAAESFRVSDADPVIQPSILWDFGIDNAMNAHIRRAGSVTYRSEKDRDGNDYYVFTPKDYTSYSHYVDIDNYDSVEADDLTWIVFRARNMHAYSQLDNHILVVAWDDANYTYNTDTEFVLEKDNEWHTYVFNLKEENEKQNGSVYGWRNFTPAEFALYPMHSGYDTPESSTYIDYVAFFPDEESARAFASKADAAAETSLEEQTVDISSNFPKGVNPVTSAIFSSVNITGKITNANGEEDSAYQISGEIPVVKGKTAKMTVKIKPQDYTYNTRTAADGTAVSDTETENPLSVQFAVYDKNDVFRCVSEVANKPTYNARDKEFEFTVPMEFLDSKEEEVTLPNGTKTTIQVSGFMPEIGDKLYIRLVTDRLAQTQSMRTEGDLEINEYQYSDVFTGMTFYQPVAYEMPPEMGLENPIQIEYGNLPLIGNTGMDLAFPFVSVGTMKINHGYRIYIGFSPVQIMDAIKGTHLSSMAGADGQYWKSLFKIGSPFQSFSEGFGAAKNNISNIREAAKDAAANGEKFDVGSLGSPSWKFDLSIGVYFDFINPTVTQENGETKSFFVFNGMGGYVSITLGFSMTWYIVLPVVFLPAYFGIEIQGTVMGYLGATLNKDVEITYDDSMNGSANINDGIASLNGGIRGSGYVQISLGVGLCGTLGVRVSGKVNFIANWEPEDPNGSWGFYVALSAGLIIDLFLFSIPLMYTFKGWPFGSFEYYSTPEKWTVTPEGKAKLSGTLQLRAGSGEDSTWMGDMGDQAMLQGAFRPNKDKTQVLAIDPYERPDSQLITLSDGKTLALAFIDSDNSKGVTQRTTLKLSIYDADTGLWSEPVPVAADNTADFQPSIAETKDGKLLVAWVSTNDASITDISTDEQAMAYLDSMDIYAAFVELDNKQIKAKIDPVYGITADTEVTRITYDVPDKEAYLDKLEANKDAFGEHLYTELKDMYDSFYEHYDANPTVVCDPVSGDAIVYYIKSDHVYLEGEDVGDHINPYTNDSVVCYMIYNAGEDIDTWTTSAGESKSKTIPAGWLFENYYRGEMDHEVGNLDDEMEIELSYLTLIHLLRGQRFLDGPINDKNERYAIPDFTAIGYDGMSVCAYTIDPDGSSDTDADKEIYLQAYDFVNHRTRCQLALTDDDVADAMPQLFRSRVNTGEDEATHTKLFWYRDGKQVVYIDVSDLLQNGVNYGTGADTRGSLKTETNGGKANTEYTYTLDGKTCYRYTAPHPVWFVTDEEQSSHTALSGADFRAVEDNRGNLYILWTENVTDEDGSAAQEIFGTGLVSYETTYEDADGNSVTTQSCSGWSKPYRITRDGLHNDEIAVAMSGENLIVVHNRFSETLVEVPEDAEYNGQVDFMPIEISDMALVSDTLEPCGSVETESISLYRVESTNEADEAAETEQVAVVTRPVGGDKLSVSVAVSNNGMNTAQGYKLSLFAVDRSGTETQIGEIETTDALVPNTSRSHSFEYTMPSDVDGLSFRAVAQEMRDAETKQYYNDRDEYTSEALKAEPVYEVENVRTYQNLDGFGARFSVTNNGNAASGADDTLNIQLWGPADLGDVYDGEDGSLYSEAISLGIGETKEFDVPVSVTPEMIGEYGFVTARVAVEKQTGSADGYTDTGYISNMEYVDFDLVQPMDMTLENMNVEVDKTADIAFSMALGEMFRGDCSITYAVDDQTVAAIENGTVVGVNGGTTTLHATHTATGATVSSTVTVTGEREIPDTPDQPSGGGRGGGGGGGASASAVIVPSTTTHGSVKSSAANAKAGEKVTITVTPDDGWQAAGVTVTDKNGNTVAVTDNGDGAYTFIMPATAVSVLPVFVKTAAGSFVDVPDSAFFADAVKWAVEQGITNGTDANHFSPNDSCTRAQMVTFLWRAAGSPEAENGIPFTDIPSDAYYAKAVAWAVENGVTKGTSETTFSPGDTVTRAQVVTFLCRYENGEASGENRFMDVPADAWYADAVTWAAERGITQGVDETHFAPNDDCTRGQIVTFLYRDMAD